MNHIQILWYVLLNLTLHEVTLWVLLPSRIQLLGENVYLNCSCHFTEECPRAPYSVAIRPAPSGVAAYKRNSGLFAPRQNSFIPPFWGMSLVEGTWLLPEREAGRKKGMGFKQLLQRLFTLFLHWGKIYKQLP